MRGIREDAEVSLESREKENTIYQNLWDTENMGWRGKFTAMRAYRKWSPEEQYIETIKQRLKTDTHPSPTNQKKQKTQINKIGDGKVPVTTDSYEMQRISRKYFEILYLNKKRKSRRNG